MTIQPRRLLFVCLGNICRSPAAEGVMQKLIDDQGLSERIQVDSAGTSSYHIGEPADRRMRTAAASRGFDLTSRARMVHHPILPTSISLSPWIKPICKSC
ncbi:MAG: hypothetical protein R3C56_37700 [Pirellulaceae bacterium]